MCGIVGGISFTGEFFPNKQELSAAAQFLKYRGPDDRGEIFRDCGGSKIAFAHSRLSIIDLSSNGHQPMMSASGRSWIVFNGEIYNYKLLKAELELKNFSFRTLSDTEVILNAFECWGIETALSKLDGMFAFALFDVRQNALFLARDRFGKKPLYYFAREKQLIFSSDIRSFGAIPSIPRSIDLHALGYLFSELATPHENSIWYGIRKLKPATFLRFDGGGIMQYKSYWQLSYTEDCRLDRSELIAKTDELLNNAVKKRLVADVKVSAMLSGGIDSSLIVAKMAEQTLGRVKTYSVGFNENAFNELPYSRYVADRFNTDHTEIMIQAKDFANINHIINEFGEPFADSSMIPTYWICKEIAKTEKVVQGGDGGDELFAGYHSYYFAYKFDVVKAYGWMLPIAKLLQRIYPCYRTEFLVQLLLQTKKPRHALLNRNLGFDGTCLKKLLNDDVFFESIDNEHRSIWGCYTPESSDDLINVMSASVRTRLLNDYLVKIDRASMYASLEMRSPFLDKDMAEFSSTLRAEQLFYKTGPKSILKEISEKYFKHDFVYRKKMGFGVPVGEWFKGELSNHVREVVLGGKQRLIDLNYSYIEEIIDSHCDGVKDRTNELWPLYVFHIWANSQ